MAHKKSKKHRRRRVGAMGFGGKKDTGLKLLSLAGGFVMAGTINGMIDNAFQKKDAAGLVTSPAWLTGPLPAIGEIGIGGLLLMKKTAGGTIGTILKVGGGVLAGAGLRRALTSMGVLTGYQSVPVIGRHRMTGYQSTPVIGKTMPPQLSGTPAQLQGYRVNGYVSSGSGVMGSCDNGSGVTSSGSGCMG